MEESSRSSSPSTARQFARWAIPSAADMIFVALLAALVLTPLSVRLLGDAGIGWHIRTGQQILATHSIPRTDPFSSSLAGKPWFAWEWLFDVVVGWLEAHFGLNGVVGFATIVIAAVFAGTFRLLIKRGVNIAVALVLVLLALAASMIHFLARPHVVSWLLALIFFCILDNSERECFSGTLSAKRRRLWILPPLLLIWANLHAGFLLGFVLLALFWLAATWTWLRAKQDRMEEAFLRIAAGRRSRNLLWIGLLSAAATLVNPYGWKLHAHIYSYLSNRYLIDRIEEFQSPNFHGAPQMCFLALVLIALATLAARWRGVRTVELPVSHALIAVFAVYTGIYSSRNIPVSSLLLAIVIAPLISPLAGRLFQNMQAVEASRRGHVWAATAIVLTLAVIANGGGAGSRTLIDAHFDPKRMPVEAADSIEQAGVKGPIFSPDHWGGYLIYRFYPHLQVVIDDRHDFYGAAFLKSYLKTMRVERGWQDFLREHPASCLLLPRDAALANVLIESREWKAVYADDVAIAFVPANAGDVNSK